MPSVVLLPAGKALTGRAAADIFFGSLGNHGIGVGRTAERIGEARPPAAMAGCETRSA
ncbi:hypothetical protein [Streptomyces sp. NPDC102462]|uniref:hypothetical protein n=1 Tax=Streptomyces sp. NPDC102462 TaxID=3366178 RepID=UPI00382BCAE4